VLSTPQRGRRAWWVALPAGIGALLMVMAANGLTTALGVSSTASVLLALAACGCWAAAAAVWSGPPQDAPVAVDLTSVHSQQPTTNATAADATPSPLDLIATDWERALLSRLPGLSFIVQRVTEGALTDWLLLAGHGSIDAGQAPADAAIHAPELLSHWLARHPQFPPAEVVSALQATTDAPGIGQRTWRVLPLGIHHSVLWQPLPQAPASNSSPRAPAPPENERESIAYTVSHDLRAPIRVIEGFTRIVREDYGHLLDRIGNDHLDRVLGAATRMNTMIDALLALSRLSSQPLLREPVPLSQMATQIIEELCAQAPARVIQAVIEPALMAQGDPAQLRTVLDNLLGNAWKYSARRAESQIEFGVTRLTRLRPGVSEAQDRTVYFVRDNGAGFDMRFAERLFGAFQRLHSASEFAGSGVGLASVRRIINRHGGEVWAQATVDQGACFYFTLG
jgi:signal transduction histidine kinase